MRLIFPLCVATLAIGCASGEPPHLSLKLDRGVARADTTPDDLVPHHDLYSPRKDTGAPDAMADGASPDQGCVKGTPDHCARCGDVCPPGKDTTSTLRVCQKATCTVQCKGEYYDVNGTASDGCEVQDDMPLATSAASARDMGKTKDCDSKNQKTGHVPSDSAAHLVAPVSRPNGRPHWFKLHITDSTFCSVEAKVTVKLTGLPPKGRYQVDAYYLCDNKKKLATVTKTGSGGSSVTVDAATNCTTLGDDSGTVYIKVAKLSGPHSNGSYLVDILP